MLIVMSESSSSLHVYIWTSNRELKEEQAVDVTVIWMNEEVGRSHKLIYSSSFGSRKRKCGNNLSGRDFIVSREWSADFEIGRTQWLYEISLRVSQENCCNEVSTKLVAVVKRPTLDRWEVYVYSDADHKVRLKRWQRSLSSDHKKTIWTTLSTMKGDINPLILKLVLINIVRKEELPVHQCGVGSLTSFNLKKP